MKITPRSWARPLAATVLALAGAAPAVADSWVASVRASGLNNPRDLAFGPDGALWVTEAGVAGGSGPSTIVRGDVQTLTFSGSVTRVDAVGQARVLGGLPSLWSAAAQSAVSGPADLGWDAGGGLQLLIGAGIHPGVRFTDLAPAGHALGRLVWLGGAVDVSAHEALFNPDGLAVDSNPWGLALLPGGDRLVTDAGANTLLRVDAAGAVATLAVLPARSFGGPRPTESVPTGVALGPDGGFYVGELTGYPFPGGQARVHRVAADGSQAVVATGFTTIIDLEFDAAGRLVVLEHDADGLLAPGTQGRLWRLEGDGSRTLLFDDLVMPTGLAVGADGAFYVANRGHGDGLGEVLRISPVPEPGAAATLLAGLAALAGLRRRRARGRGPWAPWGRRPEAQA